MLRNILRLPVGLAVLLAMQGLGSAGQPASSRPTSIVRKLPNTTQGPLWPPSELVDRDGNFIVVGLVLTEIAPGMVVPIPGAALVSKDTVPPLDANGKEDFSDILGAPHQVIRHLDLSPGSPDLDMELFTASFGPPVGDFGGTARVPREGDSRYNLNSLGTVCADLFPTDAQKQVFTRPSFPLSQVPASDFQGDQVEYDVDDGSPFVPIRRSGSECFPSGCPGEDMFSFRDTTPITLGRWLAATGTVKVQLRNFDARLDAYTHARFDYHLRGLIPHGVYTFWAIRTNAFFNQLPDPIAIPNVRVADDEGKIDASFLVANPFPDPATDAAGNRIIILAVAYHPDFQNWGACFSKLGPGVDAMAAFSTVADGTVDLTDYITKAPLAE